MVVGDRDRDDINVVHAAVAEGLDQVGQQAVAGRAELAGTAAPAFDVPLNIEPLSQQVDQVLAQHPLVDLVAGQAAVDEHESAAPCERAKWPEREVNPAQHIVRRETVLHQRGAQHQRIEVGTMAGEKNQRVALAELAHLGQTRPSEVDLVGAGKVSAELLPAVDGGPALSGDHLPQARLSAPVDVLG